MSGPCSPGINILHKGAPGDWQPSWPWCTLCRAVGFVCQKRERAQIGSTQNALWWQILGAPLVSARRRPRYQNGPTPHKVDRKKKEKNLPCLWAQTATGATGAESLTATKERASFLPTNCVGGSTHNVVYTNPTWALVGSCHLLHNHD